VTGYVNVSNGNETLLAMAMTVPPPLLSCPDACFCTCILRLWPQIRPKPLTKPTTRNSTHETRFNPCGRLTPRPLLASTPARTRSCSTTGDYNGDGHSDNDGDVSLLLPHFHVAMMFVMEQACLSLSCARSRAANSGVYDEPACGNTCAALARSATLRPCNIAQT
jgi:hypothetical protein